MFDDLGVGQTVDPFLLSALNGRFWPELSPGPTCTALQSKASQRAWRSYEADEGARCLAGKAGLRLDQEYGPRCSYRKTEWLHTACLACSAQADYRLAYILDKNTIGEKVCRACCWREWYRGEEDIHYTNGMSLVEAKQRLVAAGLGEAPVVMSEGETRALACKNGYEFVELLQGTRPGEQLLVVRCASCGRQTVERVSDVSFGCTCAKSKK